MDGAGATGMPVEHRSTRSTCCYCGVGCGVVIHSERDARGRESITAVEGDPDHPANAITSRRSRPFGKPSGGGSDREARSHHRSTTSTTPAGSRAVCAGPGTRV